MNLFYGVLAGVVSYLLVGMVATGAWPLVAGLVVGSAVAFGWDRWTRR